mmetsp:Transcript_35368/g.83935  ORF Transcript_35368/g.83935 Transcript_35368/m.83935 type:complete len:218 (+) Transcript_35368:47-700(+)
MALLSRSRSLRSMISRTLCTNSPRPPPPPIGGSPRREAEGRGLEGGSEDVRPMSGGPSGLLLALKSRSLVVPLNSNRRAIPSPSRDPSSPSCKLSLRCTRAVVPEMRSLIPSSSAIDSRLAPPPAALGRSGSSSSSLHSRPPCAHDAATAEMTAARHSGFSEKVPSLSSPLKLSIECRSASITPLALKFELPKARRACSFAGGSIRKVTFSFEILFR